MVPPESTDSSSVPFSLSLSPSGHLHVERDGEFSYPLPERNAEKIETAFERGSGHGLLHLGLRFPGGELGSTIGFWRDLAKIFLSRLCTLPDLDAALQAGLALPLEPDEAEATCRAAPAMRGGEYLGPAILRALWEEIGRSFALEARESGLDAGSFLKAENPLWSSVGRVFFHLAENKRQSERPFAFLATYTARLSSQGKLQHVPLGKALKDQAAAANRSALLALLVPVQKAAAESPFLKELVESGRLFQAQAWSPAEAYAFLREVPRLEAKGISVRIPDWWNSRRPPRVRVGIRVGDATPAGLGLDAVLDFSVDLSLDGEPISKAEWQEILQSSGGLALVKGRWVEVDQEKLSGLLAEWKALEKQTKREGVSFLEGMRLLARLPGDGGQSIAGATADAGASGHGGDGAETASGWLQVEPGEWLQGVLRELENPSARDCDLSAKELRATLRPYQAQGVQWLWLLHRLRLGGCLADDMGLGKTIQILGLLLLLKRRGGKAPERRPSLLVLPASLIGNWKAECERFAPSLQILILHPSEWEGALPSAAPPRFAEADLVITTYTMLPRLAWLREEEWGLAVLDEAQAIKNPGARQTQAVKTLRSLHRVALTGTPVENRLGDLWSLFDFLQPGLLGSAKEFAGLAYETCGAEGAEAYARIRGLVRPYLLRRLKTDRRVIADLPEKQELKVFCGLRKKQAVLYQQAVEELARVMGKTLGIQRRGAILAFIMRFKQICNHPSQWSGDGAFDPEESGKLARLRELCEEIAARQEKVLVFTQFREMTGPLASILEPIFTRPGLILDGNTPVGKRRKLVEDFQREEGPPFFVLSLKAGGTGLNLTAASHVIHFDRWWNPAVENQATDRAFRIGQRRNVLVHKFVCRGTVEERIDGLLEAKAGMADAVLEPSAERALTEMSSEELMRFVSLDRTRAFAEG